MKTISASILLILLLVLITITAASASPENPVYLPVISHQQILAACLPPNAVTENAPVTYVVDGDTIHIMRAGQNVSLRYIGIDTPEDTSQVEFFGPQATARNSALVSGQTVTIVKDVSETDRYNRLLRYVFVGPVFVNYQLVREGFAEAYSYPPDTACFAYFQEAENLARAERLGMWAVDPTEPPATCSCTGPDLNCADFGTHDAAQACFDHCQTLGYGDIFGLDADSDGLACEGLP